MDTTILPLYQIPYPIQIRVGYWYNHTQRVSGKQKKRFFFFWYCLNTRGIRSRYSEHPSDNGEGKEKKKKKILTPGKFPAVTLRNNEVPLPTIDRHTLSLAFVDRRRQSSSSPFLPISHSNSHSLSLATPVLNQNHNFFFFSFHYASHLLSGSVAWAFSLTALGP